MKHILYILFLLINIILINNVNATKIDTKIKFIADINDNQGIDYNYLHLFVQKDNKIICQGETLQHFEKITLNDGTKTEMFKLINSGIAEFECNKEDILKNGKINPKINILVKSDNFWNINRGEIKLNPKKFTIENNTINISNTKNTNFKIELINIKGELFNKYDKKIKDIKNQIKGRLLKEQAALEESSYSREVHININNIPTNIDTFTFIFNSEIYTYNKNIINKVVTNKNIINNLIIGDITLNNLEITNGIINIDYQSDFVYIPIEIKFNITNIPEYNKNIDIYIDGVKSIYNKDKIYYLTKTQVTNGINLQFNNIKFGNIKIDKNDTVEIDYTKIINEDNLEVEIEEIDNSYLRIELDNKYIDPLGRLSYMIIADNGASKKFIIKKNKIYYNKNKKTITIDKFIYKTDPLPLYIIIDGEKIKLKDISVNYNSFIEQR